MIELEIAKKWRRIAGPTRSGDTPSEINVPDDQKELLERYPGSHGTALIYRVGEKYFQVNVAPGMFGCYLTWEVMPK